MRSFRWWAIISVVRWRGGHVTTEARRPAARRVDRCSARRTRVPQADPGGSLRGDSHDIFQQELPVYISIDSILHAIFMSEGTLLERVERGRLVPALASMLDRLLAALPRSNPSETQRDLDTYLSVARSLLRGKEATFIYRQDRELVTSLVEKIRDAKGMQSVAIFGRDRAVDFSRFRPRGYYEDSLHGATVGDDTVGFPDYFRAMVWLSHFEFNIVSRDSRSSDLQCDSRETPREVRIAMALADLASRTGAMQTFAQFEDVYRAFAGTREDLSLPEIFALMRHSGASATDPTGPDKLIRAIGGTHVRTARTHPMADCASRLPVIATMFGERIVPEIAPLTGLVHPSVADRYYLGAADVAFVLGHDRAKTYLASELARRGDLASALGASRAQLAKSAAAKPDVYATWLRAVLALSESPSGVPKYMKTDAYADLRMQSALVGYGQIRHNFVLLAGEGYDSYGCEIPDGWVEPALGTYDALLAYAKAARALAATKDDHAYVDRLENVLTMLRSIAKTELDGKALSEPQRRWLGMVTEYTPPGAYSDSGEPPKYTGWYYDLFPDREKGAEYADFVADYFTLTVEGKVAYLGASGVRMGVFVVDTGGGPRAMVGPIANGYELHGELSDERLDDLTVDKASGKSAPWQASFVAPKPGLLPLEQASFACDDGSERFVLTSRANLGRAEITLLDHHGDPASPTLVVASVGPQASIVAFDVRSPTPPDAGPIYEGIPYGIYARGEPFEGWEIRLVERGVTNAVMPTVYPGSGD